MGVLHEECYFFGPYKLQQIFGNSHVTVSTSWTHVLDLIDRAFTIRYLKLKMHCRLTTSGFSAAKAPLRLGFRVALDAKD